MSAKPLILSLDIATRTGACEGRAGEAPVFSTIDFRAESHEQSFGLCVSWLINRLKDDDRPDAIFVEAPISPGAFVGEYDAERGKVRMTTNPNTTILLIGLWAIVAGIASARGLVYQRVNVRTARKAFLGNGNLKSEEAKRRAYDLCHMIGWRPSNRDEADAGCIHWYACAQMAPYLRPTVSPLMRSRAATVIGGVEFAGAPK